MGWGGGVMLCYTVEGAMLKHKMADLCRLALLFGGKSLRVVK